MHSRFIVKEVYMKFRKFQLALLATALGGAMGVVSAQGTGMSTDTGSSSSVGTTAAASKASWNLRNFM